MPRTPRFRRLAAVVLLLLATGCAGTIVAPEPDPGVENRPVFVLEHGRHTSLVLTRDDESMVRYVYGDWRWYAHRETGFFRAFPTLFSRTQGTLGRREMHGPPEADVVRTQIRVALDEIHPFSAPAERIDTLLEELDSVFFDALDQVHENRAFDLDFVPHPKPYTLGDNSNHVIARWLEELGFEVRGNPMLGRWRVE